MINDEFSNLLIRYIFCINNFDLQNIIVYIYYSFVKTKCINPKHKSCKKWEETHEKNHDSIPDTQTKNTFNKNK